MLTATRGLRTTKHTHFRHLFKWVIIFLWLTVSCADKKSAENIIEVEPNITNKPLEALTYTELKTQVLPVAKLYGEQKGLGAQEWAHILERFAGQEFWNYCKLILFTGENVQTRYTFRQFFEQLETQVVTLSWFENQRELTPQQIKRNIQSIFPTADEAIWDRITQDILSFDKGALKTHLILYDSFIPGYILANLQTVFSGYNVFLDSQSTSLPPEIVSFYLNQNVQMTQINLDPEQDLSKYDAYKNKPPIAAALLLELYHQTSGQMIEEDVLAAQSINEQFAHTLLLKKTTKDIVWIESALRIVFPVVVNSILNEAHNKIKHVLKSFEELDKNPLFGNKNRKLEPQELGALFRQIQTLEAIFYFFDTDRDGLLQKEEATVAFEKIGVDSDNALSSLYQRKKFLGIIKQKDKKALSPSEILKISLDQPEIFRELDSDDKGS